MMNTDKTLILALVMACAALPVLAADAPEAAAPTPIAGPAATETPAAGKPAASKTKRKKANAAKAAAAENKASGPQPADAPVADAASPAAAVPAAEPAPVAAPQPRRVRVKDRASALAAVAAAQAAEAAPENAVAPAAAAPANASSAVAQPAGKAERPEAPAARESGKQETVKQEAVKQEAVKDQATAKPLAVPEPVLLVAESLPPAAEPLPVAECNPPFKSEVAALFDRWNASLRSGDPKKVVANYAPGSVLLPTVSNRARFTATEKEEYFAQFLQRRPEGRIDDRVIEVDCNSATDSGMYTFRFSDGTQVRARYTFAYKRVDGEWLIASHHSSAMPEKAETGPEQKPTKAAAVPVENPKGWVRFP